MSELKTIQSLRSSQVINLFLDTNPSGDNTTFVRTIKRNLNVTFSNPDGFYVRQIACGSTVIPVSINQEDGKIVEAKEIDEKVISYAISGTGLRVYSIYTDLVSSHIGCITTGTTVSPGTYFKLGKDVNDTFMFRIDDTSMPSVKAKEIFMLTLEFVKF